MTAVKLQVTRVFAKDCHELKQLESSKSHDTGLCITEWSGEGGGGVQGSTRLVAEGTESYSLNNSAPPPFLFLINTHALCVFISFAVHQVSAVLRISRRALHMNMVISLQQTLWLTISGTLSTSTTG